MHALTRTLEAIIEDTDKAGDKIEITRRATYVFRFIADQWLCAVDNSYGTTLLDNGVEP